MKPFRKTWMYKKEVLFFAFFEGDGLPKDREQGQRFYFYARQRGQSTATLMLEGAPDDVDSLIQWYYNL